MLYYNLHNTGGIILHTNSDKMRRDEMGVDEVYSKLGYKIGKTYNNNKKIIIITRLQNIKVNNKNYEKNINLEYT